MWSWPVQTEQKLLMPLKKDAEFAPLNVHDLTLFIGYMVSERGHRQTEKMYKLTGEDMTSGHGLVETCNKTLGTKIECMRWRWGCQVMRRVCLSFVIPSCPP